MNILVIGNGFDIAHGIPSSYKNFLDFVGIFKSIYGYRQTIEKLDKNERKIFYEGKLKQISNIYKDIFGLWDINNTIDPVFVEFYQMINNNTWMKFFSDRTSRYEGERNWVDIESEILYAIQMMTQERDPITGMTFDQREIGILKNDNMDENILSHVMNRLLEGKCGQTVKKQQQIKYWKELQARLRSDFVRTIRSLEIYLDYFIDFTKVSKGEIFDGIKFDRLINFNYTQTYHKLYDPCLPTDFIHGKAIYKRDKEKSNVVLGIEEFLGENQKNKDIEFISYRKYYQRIVKHCDFSYRKQVNSRDFPINTWFFGHSLSFSDKEILINLLPCSEFVTQSVQSARSYIKKSYICYYSQHTLEQQVVNLVQILGQEALNDLVCGANPKIEFVPQNEFRNKVQSIVG